MKKNWRKIVSVLVTLTLLLNPLLIYAEEVDPPHVVSTLSPSEASNSASSPSPTPSPSPEYSAIPTPTVESTSTASEPAIPTLAPEPTVVLSPTPTATPTLTDVPSPTPTPSPTPLPESTPTPTPTLSPAPVATKSSTLEGDFVEGEVIVKYKEKEIDLETGTGQKEAETFQDQHQLAEKDEIEDLNMQVLASQDKSTGQIIAELADNPEVERVEPNLIRRATATPNDTSFSNLWGLHNIGQSVNGVSGTADADIDAPEAWNLESSSQEDVLVAVLDTGVLHTHPDLTANMWDGSSCKDENGDTIVGGCPNHGWDFVNNDNDPTDDDGHGTHVAGTIAAVSNNNVGITGVSMGNNIKIMAVKFLDADGFGTLADEIKAINFARHNGARVINASFGGGGFAQSEKEVADAFSGLFVAAAGNDGFNNDSDLSTAHYPCGYNSIHIVCVAATDQDDNLADFSNFGATSVDVGAPGVNIYSTYLDNGYAFLQGTSMATPHVAGLAALVLSSSPNLSAAQVKIVVLDSGDNREALSGNTVTGKRINAFTALNQAGEGAPNIVINEFVSNASEEWVELFNPTGSSVNLTGWKLKQLTNPSAAPTEAKFADLSGTIEPQGFLVFTASGLLNNTGDWIGLYNNEEVPVRVDQVSFGTVASPYNQNVVDNPGLNQSTGRTVDGGQNFQTFGSPTPGISNGSQFNTVYVDDDWTGSGNDGGYFWGLNAFSTIDDGIDAVGLGGTINAAAGDYYESLSIEQSVTLIGAGIGESTIFDNVDCSGVINVYASSVTIQNFTLNDDSCGASTVWLNSDVTNVTIKNNEIINGYRGIEIDSDTSSIQILGNTIYDHEDFGIWLNGATNSTIQNNEIYNNSSGGIRLDDGDFSGTMFSQNNIHDNSGYGIFSYRSNVTFSPTTISNNTISNNASDGINFRYVPSGATLNIQSNTIEGNGSDGGGGIYVNQLLDSTLSIIGNNVRNNSSEGIRVNTVSNSTFTLSGNTVTNNDSTGIYLSGGGSSVDNSTVTIENNTISTNQSDGIYADVITSSTFNVLNNTIGENEGSGVYICAEGECSDSTLTINGNSISENESDGVYFYNILSSAVSIGDNDILSNEETGIYMQYIGASAPSDPSTVTLVDNTVSGNSSYGVYLGSVDEVSPVEIGSGNTISANSSSGIYLDSSVTGVVITGNTIENNSPESGSTGIVVRSATGNEAHQNVISGNGVGVENQDEENFFDATENFWGSAAGPFHEVLNQQGEGNNSVSGNVFFSPFYTDETLTTLGDLDVTIEDIDNFVDNGIFDLNDLEEGEDEVQFLTVRQQLEFEVEEGGGENHVVLPAGVKIDLEGETQFNWKNLSVQAVVEETLSGLASGEVVEEALQWGIPNKELLFDKPITLSIFVGTALNGQTLSVKRSTSGSSGWTNSGIVAPATCVVALGLCSFQATKASFFAATSTPSPTPTPTSAPTPTPTPATTSGGGGGGDGGSGAATAPSCGDGKPGSAPKLTAATAGVNSVTLSWEEANDPVSYYLIAYGTTPGSLQFGNPNIGSKGTATFTVSGLSGGTRYYFRIRAGNGCTPGDYSNELASTPRGVAISSRQALGFAPGVLGKQGEKKVEAVQQPSPTVEAESALPAVQRVKTGFLAAIGGFLTRITTFFGRIFGK